MHRHLIPADPADWPARRPVLPQSACNGNCNQGRACDCVPAVDSEEPMPRMSEADRALAVVVYTVSACLSLSFIAWLCLEFFA